MLLTISLNSLLTNLHSNEYNVNYEACKAELIAQNNYNTDEQAFECTRNRSITIKILGTILFREGSVFE